MTHTMFPCFLPTSNDGDEEDTVPPEKIPRDCRMLVCDEHDRWGWSNCEFGMMHPDCDAYMEAAISKAKGEQ
jgi:hypothetical protein